MRFKNHTIDAGTAGTTFVNHITGEYRFFPAGDPSGDFFDLMDEIENEWDAEEDNYSVVLDRLWERINQGDMK